MICVNFDAKEMRVTKKEQVFQLIENAILHNVEYKLKLIKNNVDLLQRTLDDADLDIIKILKSGKLCISDKSVEISVQKSISILKFTIDFDAMTDNEVNSLQISFQTENNGVSMEIKTTANVKRPEKDIGGDLRVLIAEQFPEICK